MSPQDEYRAENPDPPALSGRTTPHSQGGDGEITPGRAQTTRVDLVRKVFGLLFIAAAAAVFVLRFDFPPTIIGWIGRAILFSVTALIAWVFLYVCVAIGEQIQSGIARLKDRENWGDTADSVEGEGGGTADTFHSDTWGPNGRKKEWRGWFHWASRLFQSIITFLFFLSIYLHYVLDDYGPLSLLHFLVTSVALYIFICLIALGGFSLILRIGWQWFELKIWRVLSSIIIGIPCIVLAIGLVRIIDVNPLLAAPDIVSGPKTTTRAICLSSDSDIYVSRNSGYRNPLPSQRYIQHRFTLRDGQEEPFEATMRLLLSAHSPLAVELQMKCSDHEPFTLVYFPSIKRVVDVK